MRRRRRKPVLFRRLLFALCFVAAAAAMTSIMVQPQEQNKTVLLDKTPAPSMTVRATSYHEPQERTPEPATEQQPETTPEETPKPFTPDQTEIEMIAKTIWGEARGTTTTEKAAVVWCILNRVDNEDFPDTVADVITQRNQFAGYSDSYPVTEEHVEIAADVLTRWNAEKTGTENSGRVLPADYLFFCGDGKHNHFRKAYRDSGEYWDWSLESPYENEKGE